MARWRDIFTILVDMVPISFASIIMCSRILCALCEWKRNYCIADDVVSWWLCIVELQVAIKLSIKMSIYYFCVTRDRYSVFIEYFASKQRLAFPLNRCSKFISGNVQKKTPVHQHHIVLVKHQRVARSIGQIASIKSWVLQLREGEMHAPDDRRLTTTPQQHHCTAHTPTESKIFPFVLVWTACTSHKSLPSNARLFIFFSSVQPFCVQKISRTIHVFHGADFIFD